MPLHNRIEGRILKEKMRAAQEKRITISFYKYHQISEPQILRDQLFADLETLGVLGRIYVANEGINAQISAPAENLDALRNYLYSIDFLNGVRLNVAVEDDGKSFFKLKICRFIFSSSIFLLNSITLCINAFSKGCITLSAIFSCISKAAVKIFLSLGSRSFSFSYF